MAGNASPRSVTFRAVLKDRVGDSGPGVVIFWVWYRGSFHLSFQSGFCGLRKLIIDGHVHAVSTHSRCLADFWWLVVAEFSLAVLNSILLRTTRLLGFAVG